MNKNCKIKTISIMLFLSLLIFSQIFVDKVYAGDIAVTPIADITIHYEDQAYHPDEEYLYGGNMDGVYPYTSAIKFDISEVHGKVTNATLRIFITGYSSDTTFNVYGASDDDWVEQEGTLMLTSTVLLAENISVTSADRMNFKTISLSNLSYFEDKSDKSNVTILIKEGTGGSADWFDFFSSEYSYDVFKPELSISYVTSPTVTTNPTITSITLSSATVSGNVVSDGGLPITERGIEYKKSSDSESNYVKKVESGTAVGAYSVNLTGLEPGTSYDVRAYATNSMGTSYGDIVTFSTDANTNPTISAISDQSTNVDEAISNIAFTIDDAETSLESLGVSVTSDNEALLPSTACVVGGSGANRTLTMTPALNQHGTANVTITVTDSNGGTSQRTFTVTVNKVPPRIQTVAVPSDGVYKVGDNLDFTANYNEAVIVTGTPQLTLTIGSETRTADYVSGSESTALVFRYTVQTGDNDNDGIVVDGLELNGGTIKDSVGNNATLTLNGVVSTAGVKVDTTAPTETLVGVAPTSYGLSDGKITGTTTAMEYKLSTASTWTAVTGTEITGLVAGTYNVRYAAKTGFNAGTAVDVVVGNGPNTNLAVDTIVYSPTIFPTAVAVDSTGNVYFADWENNKVKKWDKKSKEVTEIVSSGLNDPYGVAVDSEGNVYIADRMSNEIKKWDKVSGNVTTLVSGLNNPYGVAVDSEGNVYIADTFNNEVKKWNKASRSVTTLVSGFNYPLFSPYGVAVDSTGNVYILDSRSIIKWEKEYRSVIPLVFELNNPKGIAVDSTGNLYIADAVNNAIKKWNKETGIGTTLVSSGLNQPSGVAVDSTGNVYIADLWNYVIKRIPALAAPTASPAGGALISGSKVTLSSATAGADIYYTLDGSIPTTSSTRYTEPITVSSEGTIKAIAVKSGMIDSNIMSESYTVIQMYIISAQSADSTLGTVGEGGAYAAGTSVTLIAEPRMGCKFVKWSSDAEGNNVVSTNKTLTITVSNSSTYYAWFTIDKYTLTVGDFNSLAGTVSGVKEEGYSYNEGAVLTAEAKTGYAFQGWRNEYGVTVSTSPTLSFNVSGNMTITPVFTQIEESTTYYTVAFYHQAGNLLKSEIVAENSTITPPSTPSKVGYDFIGWSTDGKNPVEFNGDGSITITSNMTFKPLFRVKEVNYSLTVNGVVQGSYTPLSSVTAQVLDLDIPEGKKFAYWSDIDGNVVSYSNLYNFSITGNIELTAVYENLAVDVIKNPTLTLSVPTYELVSIGKHKMIWYAAMDLPEGYTLVESGILRVVSETPQTNEQMTFDSEGIYRRIIQVSGSIPNQYYYSVTAADGKGVSVRAYIVVRNKDGNLETIFSEVQYGCYE